MEVPPQAAEEQSSPAGQVINLEAIRDGNTSAYEPGLYLVPRVPSGALVGDRIYRPADEIGLYRTFSETPTTEEGVRDFANEFGSLGGAVRKRISPPPGYDPRSHVWSEPLKSWGTEIEKMKEAVHLYDSCRAADKKTLTHLIHWSAREVIYVRPKSQFMTESDLLIASRDSSVSAFSDPIGYYERGDVLMPAWRALSRIVYISQHPAKPQLVMDRMKPSPRFASRLVPDSLISAVWTRIHDAIRHNKDHRRCDQCSRWFEAVPEKNKDARFCSNACRFKAYRERQRQARMLHGEGMTFEQIALKVGSNVETLKRWVAE